MRLKTVRTGTGVLVNPGKKMALCHQSELETPKYKFTIFTVQEPYPMNVKESEIRGCVANNLHLIDPELILIKEEYPLLFKDGRRAYIDILARDKYGCLTVIEIKKSDKSSRTTIQQMYKYAAFLKEKYRTESAKIRCFVISTTWHELNAPFAEFKQTSDYETKGFELSYSPDLPPVFCEVNPEFITGNSQPLDNFFLFTFERDSERDQSLESLTNLLKKIPSLNHVIFSLNTPESKKHSARGYDLDSHPFSIALVTFTGNSAFIEEELSRLSPSAEQLSPLLKAHLARWEKAPEAPLRNEIISRFLRLSGNFGPFKGYAPHSLNNIFGVSDFDIDPIIGGPMFDDGFFSVGEAVDMACGVCGQNPYIFNTHISPARPEHFNSTSADLKKFLKTNTRWASAINELLSSLDESDSLQIQIFNPLNIFGFFNDLYVAGTSERLAHLHALVTKKDGTEYAYFGTLNWNGRKTHPPILEAIESTYPSLDMFRTRSVINSITQYDEALSSQYDLSYELFDLSRNLVYTPHQEEKWRTSDGVPFNNLQDFVNTHSDLIVEIGEFFKKHKIGIGNGTNMVELTRN